MDIGFQHTDVSGEHLNVAGCHIQFRLQLSIFPSECIDLACQLLRSFVFALICHSSNTCLYL